MIPTNTVSQDAGLEVRQFGIGLAPAPLELGGLRNELVESTHKTQQESRENLCVWGGERVRKLQQSGWGECRVL